MFTPRRKAEDTMKNKPWKSWKTRKMAFMAVSLIWLAYAILGLVGHEFNSDILNFIFNAGVWMLGFGITLVIADKVGDKLIKRKVGNDDEEI